ncbi:MAG: hypothetical protein HBSAPP02_15370 [Phycisphaerae bacterium]|nr:MAG: hypothetical protein DCC66_02000 [Planctomycetota bacterium]GJQ26505.1 MAG: hypothetical protein HBSAPP02_15370 [Phycisphaerae bacterium]
MEDRTDAAALGRRAESVQKGSFNIGDVNGNALAGTYAVPEVKLVLDANPLNPDRTCMVWSASTRQFKVQPIVRSGIERNSIAPWRREKIRDNPSGDVIGKAVMGHGCGMAEYGPRVGLLYYLFIHNRYDRREWGGDDVDTMDAWRILDVP